MEEAAGGGRMRALVSIGWRSRDLAGEFFTILLFKKITNKQNYCHFQMQGGEEDVNDEIGGHCPRDCRSGKGVVGLHMLAAHDAIVKLQPSLMSSSPPPCPSSTPLLPCCFPLLF